MMAVVTAAEVAAAVAMAFSRSIGGDAPRNNRRRDGEGKGEAGVHGCQ